MRQVGRSWTSLSKLLTGPGPEIVYRGYRRCELWRFSSVSQLRFVVAGLRAPVRLVEFLPPTTGIIRAELLAITPLRDPRLRYRMSDRKRPQLEQIAEIEGVKPASVRVQSLAKSRVSMQLR